MKVYVVLCDCGLNGAWVEGVLSDEAAAVEVARQVNRRGRSLSDSAPGRGHYTGFGGAEVVEFEVQA